MGRERTTRQSQPYVQATEIVFVEERVKNTNFIYDNDDVFV